MDNTIKKTLLIIFISIAFFSILTLAAILIINVLNENRPMQYDISSDTQGISDQEILIGSSLALSGHASSLGTSYLHGALSYLNEINKQGGIYGRKIRLISYDDQYDPPQTIINTQKLLNEDGVFALFNFVGTPTAIRIIPIVEEANVPLLGILSGANILREPPNKYIFNIRSSYFQETEMAISFFVDRLHLKKIAVFFQGDAYGSDGLEGTKIALKKRGMEPVSFESYTRGTENVENAVEKIASSGAEAVVMIGTYTPSAKFVRLAKQKNPQLLFHSVSFVGAKEFVYKLEEDTSNVYITLVVPPPESSDQFEDVKKFNDTFLKYYPEEKPSPEAFEGFINAKVLIEALRKCGEYPNRNNFIASLESLRSFSIGTDDNVTFGPSDRQGLDKAYLTSIKDGNLFVVEN